MSTLSDRSNYAALLACVKDGAKALITKNLKHQIIRYPGGELKIIDGYNRDAVYSIKDPGPVYLIGRYLVSLVFFTKRIQVNYIYDFTMNIPVNKTKVFEIREMWLEGFFTRNDEIYFAGKLIVNHNYQVVKLDLVSDQIHITEIGKELIPDQTLESIFYVADNTVFIVFNDEHNYYLRQIDLFTKKSFDQRLMNRTPGGNTVDFYYHNKNKFYLTVNSTINTQDENGCLRNYIKNPRFIEKEKIYLNSNGSLIYFGDQGSFRFDNRGLSQDYRDHSFSYPHSEIERYFPPLSYLPIIQHLREIGTIYHIHRYHEVYIPRPAFDLILLEYLLDIFPLANRRLVNLLINFFQNPGSIPDLHQAIISTY